MKNQQGAPEALRPIARYKIGYATDGWGMRSSTPSGIPHHAGAWVRYEDHVAALVEAQQPAPTPQSDIPAEQLALLDAATCEMQERTKISTTLIGVPTPQADSQPAPVLDRDRIREIFMAHGFTVKEGQTDLKQYVYDAADALLRAARAPADSVTAQAGGAGLMVDRATVIEWLDANDIEVTDRQMEGLFHFAVPAPPTPPAQPNPLRAALLKCIAVIERTAHCNEADRLAAADEARQALAAQAADSVLEDAARWKWATAQAEFFSMVVDGTGLLCATLPEAEAAIDAAKGAPHG